MEREQKNGGENAQYQRRKFMGAIAEMYGRTEEDAEKERQRKLAYRQELG